jgi:hypothetical protein
MLRLNGGEGGIRTPDRLTPMSDFESGAFNRALPPLRIVNNLKSITYAVSRLGAECSLLQWCQLRCQFRFGI